MENPIKMDDLGVPLLLETPKYRSRSKIWEGKLPVVRRRIREAGEVFMWISIGSVNATFKGCPFRIPLRDPRFEGGKSSSTIFLKMVRWNSETNQPKNWNMVDFLRDASKKQPPHGWCQHGWHVVDLDLPQNCCPRSPLPSLWVLRCLCHLALPVTLVGSDFPTDSV